MRTSDAPTLQRAPHLATDPTEDLRLLTADLRLSEQLHQHLRLHPSRPLSVTPADLPIFERVTRFPASLLLLEDPPSPHPTHPAAPRIQPRRWLHWWQRLTHRRALPADPVAPVLLLDLRDLPAPDAIHRQVLDVCNQVRARICLVVITTNWCVADARINPDTLAVHLQYAGVMLTDPTWQQQQPIVTRLPRDQGVRLALLHAIEAFNEDNAARVFQVGRTPLLPGVPCVDLADLQRVLSTVNPASAV